MTRVFLEWAWLLRLNNPGDRPTKQGVSISRYAVHFREKDIPPWTVPVHWTQHCVQATTMRVVMKSVEIFTYILVLPANRIHDTDVRESLQIRSG